MEIRVLRYFLTVAREESITKASEVLLRRRAEEILQLVDKTEKEQMDKGLIDMGKYEFIRLDRKEKWVVLMRPDDPLAEKESVTAKDLSELPLILPRRTSVQSELASWFGGYFDKLDVAFTSNLSTNGAIMVSNGLAYSLVIEGDGSILGFCKSGIQTAITGADGNECAGIETRAAVQPCRYKIY